MATTEPQADVVSAEDLQPLWAIAAEGLTAPGFPERVLGAPIALR